MPTTGVVVVDFRWGDMSVYVDPLHEWGGSATFRWKHSCHMFADTADELHAFAKKIGMRREWAQTGGMLHYDLNANRRRVAVLFGAKEVSFAYMVMFMKRAR